jgi:hypothetical protein
MKFKKVLILVFILLTLLICYPLLIQRSFINDETNEKHITILKRPSGVYIIPYKYYGLLKPSKNYIKYKHKHSFNIIWEPHNNSFKLSIIDSALEPYEYENYLDENIEFLMHENKNEKKKYLRDSYKESEIIDVYLSDYSFFLGKNSWHYD